MLGRAGVGALSWTQGRRQARCVLDLLPGEGAGASGGKEVTFGSVRSSCLAGNLVHLCSSSAASTCQPRTCFRVFVRKSRLSVGDMFQDPR